MAVIPSLSIFIGAFLLTVCVIAAINYRMLPRLGTVPPVRPEPAHSVPEPQRGIRVSILVPARNEAANIGACVTSLLAQRDVALELLVLDDASTDDTAAMACAAGGGDPRLRVLHGEPLPPGWVGKSWACHQLACAASGQLLIFTDADVRWQPGALAAVVAQLEQDQVDAVTVWPTQQTGSWGERLVVPLMALAVLGYLPVWLINNTDWPGTGAANGQCLAFHRSAYERIGGHRAVRGTVLEDVALARRLKRARLWLRMVDGAGLLTCRMYDGWPAVRDGYAKNILAGHGDRIALLLLSILFHLLVFVWPPLWLLTGWAWLSPWGWPGVPLLLAGLGVTARAITAHATGQRVWDALLLPVSVLLMTRIALRSIGWRLRGAGRWKGRTI